MKQKQAISKDVMTMSVNTGRTEIRADKEGENIIRGYAVVFDDTYTYRDWGGEKWTERVDSNFFKDVDMSNVLLLRDHDYSRVLGRAGKNLRLEIDDKGLFYECNLPNTELARETYELVKNEICDQCSFGFTIEEEKIDYGNKSILLTKCDALYELTITPIPAYQSTVVITMNNYQNAKYEETKARQRAEADKANAEKLAAEKTEARIDELISKINNF